MSLLTNPIAYPVASFPSELRDAIQEALGVVQTTDVIAATSVLGALSTAIGPNADWVHPATGQVRPCTLFLLVMALSGERKSTTDALISKPIYDFDEQTITCHEEEMAKREVKSPDSDATAMKKPMKSKLVRIVRQDVSRRAVAEALRGQGRSITLMTDEGDILLNGTMMKHLGALNSYWDGKRIQPYDRGNDNVLVSRSPRVTLNMMVQPAVMEEFMSKQTKATYGSGHFARYLLARSPSIQGFRQQTSGTKDLRFLPAFHKRIASLLNDYRIKVDADHVARDVLEFDDEAKRLWFDIATRVEEDIKPGNFLSDIADFGSKYMEIVSRIACLLHYYLADTDAQPSETPESRSERIGKISAHTLSYAERIAAWHLGEYKSIFAPPIQPLPRVVDANALYAYLFRTRYWTYLHRLQANDDRAAEELTVPKNYIRQYCGVRGGERFNDAIAELCWRGAICISLGKNNTQFISLNTQHFQANPI